MLLVLRAVASRQDGDALLFSIARQGRGQVFVDQSPQSVPLRWVPWR